MAFTISWVINHSKKISIAITFPAPPAVCPAAVPALDPSGALFRSHRSHCWGPGSYRASGRYPCFVRIMTAWRNTWVIHYCGLLLRERETERQREKRERGGGIYVSVYMYLYIYILYTICMYSAMPSRSITATACYFLHKICVFNPIRRYNMSHYLLPSGNLT